MEPIEISCSDKFQVTGQIRSLCSFSFFFPSPFYLRTLGRVPSGIKASSSRGSGGESQFVNSLNLSSSKVEIQFQSWGSIFFFNLGFVHFLLFHNLRLYPPLPPSIPVFLSFSCTTWPPACHLCYFLELLREVRVSRRTEGNKDSEMNPSSIFVLRTSAPNLRGVSRLSGSGAKLQANQANRSSGTS